LFTHLIGTTQFQSNPYMTDSMSYVVMDTTIQTRILLQFFHTLKGCMSMIQVRIQTLTALQSSRSSLRTSFSTSGESTN